MDETGDHSLEALDKTFPVFVLTLIICESDVYTDTIVPIFYWLKFAMFGHEGVILHSRDIRKSQGVFGILTDPKRRQMFYSAINMIMGLAEYKIIAVGIRKQAHKDRYGVWAESPYDLALKFVLERLLPMLEGAKQTDIKIIAEARGSRENAELRKTFQRFTEFGTEYITARRFQAIHFDLEFMDKRMNIIGTQMADLAGYPIARHVLASSSPNPAFDVIKPKFYQGPGLVKGLKIFP